MHDVLGVGLHGQRESFAVAERGARRWTAGHVFAIGAEHVEDALAHAGHGAHVDHDVGAVRDLDADVRDRRTERAHRERHDVHRAALHAAGEQAVQRLAHLGRFFPVVGWAGVILVLRADVGAVFDARDVRGIGPGQVGILRFWSLSLISMPDWTISAQRRSYSSREPSAQRCGPAGSARRSRRPTFQAFVFDVVGAFSGTVWLMAGLSKDKLEKGVLPWRGGSDCKRRAAGKGRNYATAVPR